MKDSAQEFGDQEDSGRRSRRGLTIPWPALSIGLLIVAVGSLAALVIVATMSDADALATVALVLAILAFASQLIVSAAQTASANEQYRQINRLYEDTRAVLQRIRSQSKMMLANQSDQFNKVLDHVLSPSSIESAVAEVTGESSAGIQDDSGDSSPADVNEVAKVLRAEAERAISVERAGRPVDRPDRRVPERSELRRFPKEEEGREVAARFLALSPDAKRYITDAAAEALKNPSAPIRIGQVLPTPIDELPPFFRELEAAGFLILEPYRRGGETRTGRIITSDGFIAIRFFTAHGVVPEYLREVIGSSEAERPKRSS